MKSLPLNFGAVTKATEWLGKNGGSLSRVDAGGSRVMAGDWIKMKRGLRHDPKVIAISRELSSNRYFMDWWSDPQGVTCERHVTEFVTFANVTRVTVCGLLDVWASLNNLLKNDGEAEFMTLQDIDDIAEIPCFGEAMKAVGWVLEKETGGLVFPNFSENNTTAKERSPAKSDAQRAKEYRERKKAEKEGEKAESKNVTNVTSRHIEKRREEKSKKETNVSCPTTSDVLEKIWPLAPKISRSRSSQKQVSDEWTRIKAKDRPSVETLIEAIKAWNESEKWQEGFAEGLHLWIKRKQWENLPTPEIETRAGIDANAGTREVTFGGRSGKVTKLKS